MLRYLCIPFILLLVFACRKEEEDLTFNFTKLDRNIPTEANVAQFDVVTENIVVAACLKEYYSDFELSLYISLDGGKTWNSMPAPINTIETLESIVFTDEENGTLVANNRAWRTVNGGVNWVQVATFGLPIPMVMATKDEIGNIYFIEKQGYFDSHIYVSAPAAIYVTECGTFHTNYNTMVRGKRSGDRIFLFPDEVCYDFEIQSLQMGTWNHEIVDGIIGNCYNDVLDASYAEGRILLTRKGGWDFELNFHDGAGATDYLFGDPASNDLPTSTWMGDYFIVAGDELMLTNRSGYWERVNLNGKGLHNNNYSQITHIGKGWFYVSGENGSFAKGTILL